MSIPSSLLQNIYVSFAIGKNEKGKLEYSEPILISAQIGETTSFVIVDNAGYAKSYDKKIIVPLGEKSQYINEQSLLWVDALPNANKDNMDYKIERVGKIIDNNFTLYCNSLTPNNKVIYFEYDGKIFQSNMDFDTKNLVATVPINKYLPINTKTRVWLTKPDKENLEKNLVSLVYKEKINNSYVLKFKKCLNPNQI